MKLETQAGQHFDMETIGRDVKRLWSTAVLSDIRVERSDSEDGINLVFNVVENPRLQLHEMKVEPGGYDFKLKLPAGSAISSFRAHQIALQAQRQLVAEGYPDAEVESELVPFSGRQVDLRLMVHTGDSPIKIKEIEFTGNTALSEKELRSALQEIRIRQILPRLPKRPNGWRLYASYSENAVNSDLARIRSLYISRGYFDAKVRLDHLDINGPDARIRIFADAGPMYRISEWSVSGPAMATIVRQPASQVLRARDLCSTLFKARRDTERDGVLDFTATMQVQVDRTGGSESPAASLDVRVTRGHVYRVGRIEITGNRHYTEAAIRSNFVLQEDDLFDEHRLRASIQKLNESRLFDPIGIDDVLIQPNEKTGVADVLIRVSEPKRNSWMISGPVGPSSFAGPLQASVASRLRSWGRGFLELSTYTVSLSALAFAGPITPVLGLSSKIAALPVLALRRPYTPGEGWLSGFTVAPQLGWEFPAISYAVTQLERRTLPLIQGNQLEPDLMITVSTPNATEPMFCPAPPPRLHIARHLGALGLEFLTGLGSI